MTSFDAHIRARLRRAILGAVLAIVTVAGLSASPSATAVPAASDPAAEKAKVDARIARLEEQLDDSTAGLKKAYIALERTKAALPSAEAELADAQAASLAAEQANTAAARDLEVAQAQEAKASAELAATQNSLVRAHEKVAGFAAQIYQEQGFGPLDAALSSTTPQQFADRLAMVDTVSQVQGQAMNQLATEVASQKTIEDRLIALRAESEAKKRAAQEAADAAAARQAAAASAKAALDELKAKQVSQAAAVEKQVDGEKAALAEQQAQQRKLQAQLAAIAAEEARKERARQAAAAKARAEAEAKARARAKKAGKKYTPPAKKPSGSSGSSGSTGGGIVGYPVPNPVVTSEYGMRFHPKLRYWRLHSGIDFGSSCGTPVYAARSGTIIQAGWAGGYGNRIVVNHGWVNGGSLATSYNHMQRLVRSGGSVSRGTLIGYVGTTGLSTGCHMHFEVLRNGSYVNPRGYL